jgi:hypothetical protein
LTKRKNAIKRNQKRQNSDFMNESSTDKPFVKIKILGQQYTALLDSGSNISILGSKLFAKIKQGNKTKSWYSNKQIKMLDGSIKITGGLIASVQTEANEVQNNFYSIADNSSQIILGMDYIRKAKIGVSSLGWFQIKNPYKIYKYETDSNPTFACNKARLEEKTKILPELIRKIENDQNGSIKATIEKYTDTGTFSEYPGEAIGVEQELKVKEGEPPYQAPLRPLNRKMRRIMNKKIKEMIKMRLLERSDSDFLLSPVLVKKAKIKGKKAEDLDPGEDENPDNWRFCLDARPLNFRLEDVKPYQIPSIDFILTQLAEAKYFSVLDLRAGFNQIPIKKECRKYMAFRGPNGIYQFRRATFGVSSTPFLFQRYIDSILKTAFWKYACVYFDDIIVFSKDLESHQKHLDDVLGKLHAANLTVNYSKAKFATTECKILGHIISENTMTIDPDKTKAVRNFPTPKTKR